MLRTFFLVLVATITTLITTGCAVVSTETVRADGSRTSTRSVEWVPSPVYSSGSFSSGFYDRDHYGRYDGRGRDLTKPVAATRANRDGTCPGMNGQNIGGVCYYY